MSRIIKKITITLIMISLILSSTNIGVLRLLAENVSAIFSYVNINFLDPETGNKITKVDVEQKVRMQISLGVASNIDTETTGIRIDIDNDNFYFNSFSPNGDTNGATYKVSVVDSNNESKVLTAVLNIDSDGRRYITIDNLKQGSTVHISLDGYFRDTTAPNEKVSVSVNGEEKASLAAKNIKNKITITNNKTVSTEKISFHDGDKEEFASNFPITYHISADVTMPDSRKGVENLENLTVNDVLSFPDGIYIVNNNSFQLSDYISFGNNSLLSISDFLPIISSDGTKVTGIKLNKVMTDSDINTYLKNGENIQLKYGDNLVVENEGVISNTLNTSYKSNNYEGSSKPVVKNTTIDITEGAKFENSTKKIKDGRNYFKYNDRRKWLVLWISCRR